MEMLVEMLDNLVHDNMGKTLAPKFQNYIGVIFMVILSCNLAGLFGLRPPTADYGVTVSYTHLDVYKRQGVIFKISLHHCQFIKISQKCKIAIIHESPSFLEKILHLL